MKSPWKSHCFIITTSALVITLCLWIHIAIISRPHNTIVVNVHENVELPDSFEKLNNPLRLLYPPVPPKEEVQTDSDTCPQACQLQVANGLKCSYQLTCNNIPTDIGAYVTNYIQTLANGMCNSQITSSCIGTDISLQVTISDSNGFTDNTLPADFLSSIVQCYQNDTTSSSEQCFDIVQLTITNCNLKYLSSTAIQSLPQLTLLYLTQNQISDIPAGFFNNSQNILDLELIDNYLTNVADEVFNPLESLNIFSFDGTSLSADNFKKALTKPLENVQILSWQGAATALGRLPADLFVNVPNLQMLYFYLSGISEIDVNALSGLASVSQLDLRYNALTTLPYNVFSGMTSLTELSLDGNNWNCTCYLQWLKTYIKRNDFPEPNCYYPEQLAFSEYSFCTDERNNCSTATDTESCTITAEGDNNFTVSCSRIQESANVYVAQYISSITNGELLCQIGRWHSHTINVALSVTYSNFDNNEIPINWLNGSINCYSSETICVKISSIALNYNNIQVINVNSFPSTNLVSLDLHMNNIEELVSGVFEEYTGLTKLTIADNPLSDLGESGIFNKLVNLQSLDLTNTTISSTVFRRAFTSELPNLEILSWDNCPSPEKTLSNNLFHYMPSLISLYMTSSNIQNVDRSAFSVLTSLQTLDISYNNLTTLPFGVFHNFNGETKINLAGNPWNCDCSLEWLKLYLLKYQQSSPPTCKTPQSLCDLYITDVDLCEEVVNITTAESSTIKTTLPPVTSTGKIEPTTGTGGTPITPTDLPKSGTQCFSVIGCTSVDYTDTDPPECSNESSVVSNDNEKPDSKSDLLNVNVTVSSDGIEVFVNSNNGTLIMQVGNLSKCWRGVNQKLMVTNVPTHQPYSICGTRLSESEMNQLLFSPSSCKIGTTDAVDTSGDQPPSELPTSAKAVILGVIVAAVGLTIGGVVTFAIMKKLFHKSQNRLYNHLRHRQNYSSFDNGSSPPTPPPRRNLYDDAVPYPWSLDHRFSIESRISGLSSDSTPTYISLRGISGPTLNPLYRDSRGSSIDSDFINPNF